MKKSYTKPEILFEDFSISTNIAAGCDYITDLQGRGECGYEIMGGFVVFTRAINGCVMTEATSGDAITDEDGGMYNNTVCYHVPATDSNVFNS